MNPKPIELTQQDVTNLHAWTRVVPENGSQDLPRQWHEDYEKSLLNRYTPGYWSAVWTIKNMWMFAAFKSREILDDMLASEEFNPSYRHIIYDPDGNAFVVPKVIEMKKID